MHEISQHASGWVLIESGIECKLTGEILPSPQDTDISPTILEHFGVASRKDWKMDGGDMLNIRRAEFITNMMRDSDQLSENGDEPDEDFGALGTRERARGRRPQAMGITIAINQDHAQERNPQNRLSRIFRACTIQLVVP